MSHHCCEKKIVRCCPKHDHKEYDKHDHKEYNKYDHKDYDKYDHKEYDKHYHKKCYDKHDHEKCYDKYDKYDKHDHKEYDKHDHNKCYDKHEKCHDKHKCCDKHEHKCCEKHDPCTQYSIKKCCSHVKQCPHPLLNAFGAELTGKKENPPNNSLAAGRLTGLLSLDQTRFDYVLQTNGLLGIQVAHFHSGGPEVNGPVVKDIPINQITGIAIASWTSTDLFRPLTPALVQALKAGNIYVNVHTSLLPDGEIRGQVEPLFIKDTKSKYYYGN